MILENCLIDELFMDSIWVEILCLLKIGLLEVYEYVFSLIFVYWDNLFYGIWSMIVIVVYKIG